MSTPEASASSAPALGPPGAGSVQASAAGVQAYCEVHVTSNLPFIKYFNVKSCCRSCFRVSWRRLVDWHEAASHTSAVAPVATHTSSLSTATDSKQVMEAPGPFKKTW